MKVIKLSENEFQKTIRNALELKKKKTQNGFLYFAKLKNCTVHLYTNKTMLLQGSEKNIIDLLKHWELKRFIKNTSVDVAFSKAKDYWGGDESGVGDFFGPIVLSLVFFEKDKTGEYIQAGIKDSKKMSDYKITKILTDFIKPKLKFVTKIINNKELHAKFQKFNLKEIICEGYLEMINQIPEVDQAFIIDGFITQMTLEKYKKKWDWKTEKPISLIPKAEDLHLGVAVASILSRGIWLEEIAKIEKILNVNICLGASRNAKLQLNKLIEVHGLKKMTAFAKIDYQHKI